MHPILYYKYTDTWSPLLLFFIFRWLRKKNKDSRRQHVLDKHRTQIGQLLGRRTHTALAIARAMRQSQSFHYVDYYGYRY